ncbi:hypothetical protein DINM_004125 [Dirofilaria immitis]|nr:hypothetical protein [Dirofilaria immitis]
MAVQQHAGRENLEVQHEVDTSIAEYWHFTDVLCLTSFITATLLAMSKFIFIVRLCNVSVRYILHKLRVAVRKSRKGPRIKLSHNYYTNFYPIQRILDNNNNNNNSNNNNNNNNNNSSIHQ